MKRTSIDEKLVYVTVGTTNFDSLIKVIDTPEFHELLQGLGFEKLLMQIGGNGSYSPKYSLPEDQEGDGKPGSLSSYYYRSKPSITSDMERASLIISHAGSGSILESLNLKVPLVVVINDSLMGNHQVELAHKLATQQFLLESTTTDLSNVLKSNLAKYLDERRTLIQEHEQVKSVSSLARNVWNSSTSSSTLNRRKSMMIVLGSGGHTHEMMAFLRSFTRECLLAQHRSYVMANTDRRSEDKIGFLETEFLDPKGKGRADAKKTYSVERIPRSREVGQSYITSVFTTLISFFVCLRLVWNEAPTLLLVNGPGTCIPICLAAWFFSLLFASHRCEIVYIESVARVQGLSLSGSIARFIADIFIVQWPELKGKAGKKAVLCNLFFPIEDKKKK